MDNFEYRCLQKALKKWDTNYDPEIKMIKLPFQSNTYHTTLRGGMIHSTNQSLTYALGLLDSEVADHDEKAFGVIETVISLQDTDRSHSTFGIWPWFYEEPLEKMNPPDWNWADFCGKQLLMAAIRHQKRFPASLTAKVKQAVFNACDAIIKRNVGPEYTNIAIMGAFVTLLAGEFYGEASYEAYGEKRLEKFYQYTKKLNVFEEYNSPHYTPIAILELTSIYAETRNTKAKMHSAELLDIAWRCVAQHFHRTTCQWAGPHQRNYGVFLKDDTKSFIQIATKGAVSFFNEEEIKYSLGWYRKGFSCPMEYYNYFLEQRESEIFETFQVNEQTKSKKAGTTYLTKDYTLGTVNKDVMWNQRRNLLGYFDNQGKPAYLWLRLLHDGYDYSSAVFVCAQHKGDALFGFNFATDGGDTHIGIDLIHGSIQAKDLRVRFEFAGDLNGVEKGSDGNDTVYTKIAANTISSKVIYARFGDEKPRWEISEEEGQLIFDYVIYSGEKKSIDFTEIQKAALLFAISINNQGEMVDVSTKEQGEYVKAIGTCADKQLELAIVLKPDEKEVLLEKNVSYVR